MPVSFKKENTTVNGIIDRLVVNNAEVLILDYKTRPLEADQNPAELAAQFRPQLALYKEAICLIYPERTIKTLLIFTSVPVRVDVPL